MIRTFLRFIFRAFFFICACLGFILLAMGFSWWFLTLSPKSLKEDAVLTIPLHGAYVEHIEGGGISSLFVRKDASLYHITRAIFHAAQDPKIKGLVVRLETPRLGMAQIQELRDALLAFQRSGKPSWCYTDSFGELSSGTGLYYLATACKEIWVQPLGQFNLMGLSFEVPFGKEILEKLEIKPEMTQRKEYKSFIEMFTRNDFSSFNREALQAVADSLLGQIVEGIAKERHLGHDKVRFLIDNGPYLLQEAQQEKLIDRINFWQALSPHVSKRLGHHITFIKPSAYLETLPSDIKGDKIALIFGSGIIQRAQEGSPLEGISMTSNEIARSFRHALRDKEVKAIVFRLNSEGGSPIASETIYNLICDAKARGKPVIISMSDAAASGGYWIAVAGSKIVAQPGTLTGSIGVFGGKFVLSQLFDKIGLKWGQITTSENGTMWSVNKPFTPIQWMKVNAFIDQIYHNFKIRVAKGRNMLPHIVEKVARGRVWTGEQALALGLIDQLGGLSTAIALAKKEANLAPYTGVQIFPKGKTVVEVFSNLWTEDEDSLSEGGAFEAILPFLRQKISLLNFFSFHPFLSMTPLPKSDSFD